MNKIECYEDYPYWIIVVSNLLQLSIYTIGVIIIKPLGIIWVLIYLAYIILLEIRLLKKSCVDCYYYGKRCAFGKGKLCSLFFKKGNKESFAGNFTWVDLIPDMLVAIIPLLIGIVTLIINFNWLLLSLVILLFLSNYIFGDYFCFMDKKKLFYLKYSKVYLLKNKKYTLIGYTDLYSRIKIDIVKRGSYQVKVLYRKKSYKFMIQIDHSNRLKVIKISE